MNGPSAETLAKLAPQVDDVLDEPDGLCPEGGRRVGKAKLGGYMTRRLVHWRKTGVYPDGDLVWQPGCDAEDCVDCGAFVSRAAKRAVPPPAKQPVAPPPPVPAQPSPVPVVAGVVERVERGVLERSSRGGRSVTVPQARSTPSPWVRTGRRAAVVVVLLVVCLVCVTVAVQGSLAGKSKLVEVLRNVEVQRSPGTPPNGQ